MTLVISESSLDAGGDEDKEFTYVVVDKVEVIVPKGASDLAQALRLALQDLCDTMVLENRVECALPEEV
jgi:hypothetical protein